MVLGPGQLGQEGGGGEDLLPAEVDVGPDVPGDVGARGVLEGGDPGQLPLVEELRPDRPVRAEAV